MEREGTHEELMKRCIQDSCTLSLVFSVLPSLAHIFKTPALKSNEPIIDFPQVLP